MTPEAHEARVRDYCSRYGVTPSPEGLPPFPSGRRETAQHREWMSLYKLHNRLRRRERGQCERCWRPASPGSVFCEAHRTAGTSRAEGRRTSADDRKALHEAQDGRCPICGQKVDLWGSVHRSAAGRPAGALLHPRCDRLVGLAEASGPEALDRLRAYLWPRRR